MAGTPSRTAAARRTRHGGAGPATGNGRLHDHARPPDPDARRRRPARRHVRADRTVRRDDPRALALRLVGSDRDPQRGGVRQPRATACCSPGAAAPSVPAVRSTRWSTRSTTAPTPWPGCASSPGSRVGSPPSAARTWASRSGRCCGPSARARDRDHLDRSARLPGRRLSSRAPSTSTTSSAGPTRRADRRTQASVGGLAAPGGRQRRVRRAIRELPLVDAGERLLQGRAPWYREWVSRRDPADPQLVAGDARRRARAGRCAGAPPDRLAGPVPPADARAVRQPRRRGRRRRASPSARGTTSRSSRRAAASSSASRWTGSTSTSAGRASGPGPLR